MAAYDVWVMRFDAGADPVPALVRLFRIDEARARELAENIPCAVKHNAPRELAEHFAEALRSIGAEVSLQPVGRELADKPPTRKRGVAPATARQKRGLKASLPALPAWLETPPRDPAKSDPERRISEPTPVSSPEPPPERKRPRVRVGKTPPLGSVSLPTADEDDEDDDTPVSQPPVAMPPPLAIPGDDDLPPVGRVPTEIPLLPPLPPRRAGRIDEDDDDLRPPPARPTEPDPPPRERPPTPPSPVPQVISMPPVQVTQADPGPQRMIGFALTIVGAAVLLARVVAGSSILRGTASWWLGVWIDAAALAALGVGVTAALRLHADRDQGLFRANRNLILVLVPLAVSLNLLVMLIRGEPHLTGTPEQRIGTLQTIAAGCRRSAKTTDECSDCCEGRHAFTDVCECFVPWRCSAGDGSDAACEVCCKEDKGASFSFRYYSRETGCICNGEASLFK